MIRTIYRNSKGNSTTDVPAAHWKVALHDSGGLLWVDFADEPRERVEKLFNRCLQFSPVGD